MYSLPHWKKLEETDLSKALEAQTSDKDLREAQTRLKDRL